MASELPIVKAKAVEASKFFTKNGCSYYKQILEQNKQYIQEPPTVIRKLGIGRDSIPGRYQAFWKELDDAKNLWKQRQELKIEDAGIVALFGLECFA
ncbi:hypothetical protein BC332_21062 [Capsicum chinense]|nr:hypothetical protein BC332_21062 [Capsicum chinense]